MKRFFRQSKGVILVEAMVALSLLIVAMGGLFALNLNTLRANNTTTDQIIATELASEGIELVKYMIQQNIEDGVPWQRNITASPPPRLRSGCFQIDYRINHIANALTSFAAPNVYRNADCPPVLDTRNHFFNPAEINSYYQPLMYRDPSFPSNFPGYTYEASGCVQPNCVVTGFRRMIAISARNSLQNGCPSSQTSPCKMEITSAVQWTTAGGVPKYVILDEMAFDWTVRQCQDRIDNEIIGDRQVDTGGVDIDGDGIPEPADPECRGNPLDNSESRF